jgi:hypothetical protein
MAASTPDLSPQPLTAAARGFVELATWFTGLAGQHAVDVAQRIDEDKFDVTGAIARAAALPLLGWAAFLNEVVDAAGVILHPPQRVRQVTSAEFVSRADWGLPKKLKVWPLRNGFGELLPDGVSVTVDPETVGEDRTFRLKATNIPHEAVGVYQGTVGPRNAPELDRMTVWLVIP